MTFAEGFIRSDLQNKEPRKPSLTSLEVNHSQIQRMNPPAFLGVLGVPVLGVTCWKSSWTLRGANVGEAQWSLVRLAEDCAIQCSALKTILFL